MTDLQKKSISTNTLDFKNIQSNFENISAQEARAWATKLRKYRDPNHKRSMFEIAMTIGPFLLIWAFALWVMQYSYIVAGLAAIPLGLLTLRLGLLQHDAGHGALFRSTRANRLVGRPLGMFNLTPYAMWRRMHISHHTHMGNLDAREIGEVYTMTVAEYRDNPAWKRMAYRIYRNPFFLGTIAPLWLFIIQHRLPFGMWKHGAEVWVSAMATNVTIFVLVGGLYAYGGWPVILVIWLPSVWVAATLGVWLFYVQHQFETASMDRQKDWSFHQKALNSSSHLVLPTWLAWVTANLGLHHIHHLCPSIPFYRLPEVLEGEPELDQAYKMDWRQSLQTVWLQVWDEDQRRLISFAEERAMNAGLPAE